MKLTSTYSVKIKHYNHIFEETVFMYRKAVDFFLDVMLKEWEGFSELTDTKQRVNAVEHLTHRTKKSPTVKYDFDTDFYKFPSYLRRAAIADALGMASSYHSNLENWEAAKKKREEKNRLVQRQDILFQRFIKAICIKERMHIKQRLRFISEIPGIIFRLHCEKQMLITLQSIVKNGRNAILPYGKREKSGF